MGESGGCGGVEPRRLERWWWWRREREERWQLWGKPSDDEERPGRLDLKRNLDGLPGAGEDDVVRWGDADRGFICEDAIVRRSYLTLRCNSVVC